MVTSEEPQDHVSRRSSAEDLKKANSRVIASLITTISRYFLLMLIVIVVGIFGFSSGSKSAIEVLLDVLNFIILGLFFVSVLIPFFVFFYYNSERRTTLLYRKAEEVTGTYWHGHPKCQFLDVDDVFTCTLTPDDNFVLEEIGTCHLKSRWQACWSGKLPRMHAILIENAQDPETVSRIAWQWSEMRLESELCHLLLDVLIPLVVTRIDETSSAHDSSNSERCYDWTIAFDNAVHALTKNNCFSPQVTQYLLTIAEDHALNHPIMDAAIKHFFKEGKEQCTSELVAWLNERQKDLDERRLLLFLGYLTTTRSPSVMRILQSFLANGESDLVKVVAGRFLVDLGKRDSIKAIVTVASHSDSQDVRTAAVKALSSLSRSRLHYLILLLDDPEVDERSREFVVALLSRSELSQAWEDHFLWLLSVTDGSKILEDELIILKRESAAKEIVKRLSNLKIAK